MYLRNIQAAVVCVAVIALPVLAQENTGYTSVALFKVKPDGAAAFVENMKKFFPPIGDKLLKEGTIHGYGVDLDMFHQPGAPNAALWMEVPSFAAFGKAEEAVNAALKGAPAVSAAILAATDPAAHADIMVQHRILNMKKAPAGALPYTDFYSLMVKPGKVGEFLQAFEKHSKPVYDKLVTDGVLIGYSVDTEVIHSEAGSKLWIVALMADLGAKDKVFEALRAAPEQRGSGVLYQALTVEGSHRDSLSHAVIFVTK